MLNNLFLKVALVLLYTSQGLLVAVSLLSAIHFAIDLNKIDKVILLRNDSTATPTILKSLQPFLIERYMLQGNETISEVRVYEFTDTVCAVFMGEDGSILASRMAYPLRDVVDPLPFLFITFTFWVSLLVLMIGGTNICEPRRKVIACLLLSHIISMLFFLVVPSVDVSFLLIMIAAFTFIGALLYLIAITYSWARISGQ